MQQKTAADKGFPYAPDLTAEDNENHAVEPGLLWQESTLVIFSDPAHGLAGFHRIGMHPNRNEASVYSWTQVDGKIVSRAKRTGLPLPAGSVTDTTLEGVTFETIDPLRSFRTRVDRDGVETDLLFESFTGPIAMSLDAPGKTIGRGHYDSLGRVTGSIRAQGESHPLDGVAFMDHSWGTRDTRTVLAHRWIMAVRDGDNHVNTFPAWTPKGRVMQGYMVLDGTLSKVAAVESELIVADDPLQANGIRARVTDQLGRTVSLRGFAAGEYNVQPYGSGYFCQHQPMVYECGRRFWRGMLEWSSPRMIPPWILEGLGMAEDNAWLKWDGLDQ